MAEETSTIEQEIDSGAYGQLFLAWEMPEYRPYRRGRWWYVGAGALLLGLLIYCVWSANFLFALIVLMIALVVYMTSVNEPRLVRVMLTEAGLTIGDALFPYRDMRRFWMAYEPPAVRTLYIEFHSALRPRMTIDLGDVNPLAVRDTLLTYVHEDADEDGMPLSDVIARILKI